MPIQYNTTKPLEDLREKIVKLMEEVKAKEPLDNAYSELTVAEAYQNVIDIIDMSPEIQLRDLYRKENADKKRKTDEFGNLKTLEDNQDDRLGNTTR